MFHRLQKKSHAAKKRIFALALLVTCIIIVPLWIFSFQKSLNNSRRTQRAAAKNSALSDLTVLKENFSTTLEQFQDALQQLEQSTENESSTGSAEPKLPSVPVTGDQLTLPKSE